MNFLLFLVTMAIAPLSTDSVITDGEYAGTWTYSINTPDGTVAGQMTLTYDGEEYSGKISAYGQDFDMLDVEQEDNELNFKTNAAGYSSSIKGTFDGDTYNAVISVEGMQIPLVAKRAK